MIELKNIHSPHDIKSLPENELPLLCETLRAALAKKLGAHGGHVGPNLGVVEAMVAMHYVFDAPTDKIVYDVSHQSYVHKMLTGRMEAFISPEHYDDVSGYTSPSENPEYDLFEIGHTSTSVSLATGLAKGRDLQGGKWNVVAFIGDGSLSGGQAFEALDCGATLGSNLIVILNDNQMSIAENHGGIYDDLKRLRDTDGTSEQNIFKSLGYEYMYVAGGNDVEALVRAFRRVKDSDRPVVVHIDTMKGKGLPVAERWKEKFHYHAPFDLETGAPLHPDTAKGWDDVFADFMRRAMEHDSRVVALTAATPDTFGFNPAWRREAGKQYVDVAIAEQQAVGMAAGLAKSGCRPVLAVASTFLQRAFDQMLHDVAINRLPVVITTFYNGVWGIPDMTHLGIFDVALISNIPEIMYLSPTCRQEYEAMLRWAVEQTSRPVAIRTPGGPLTEDNREFPTDYSDVRYETVYSGKDVAIIAEGAMFGYGRRAADMLRERGYTPTLINPRVLTQVDTACLDGLKNHKLVVTMEDHILDGGFGQKVAAYLGTSDVAVRCLGLKKEFLDRYDAAEVVKRAGLTPEQVADYVSSAVKPGAV